MGRAAEEVVWHVSSWVVYQTSTWRQRGGVECNSVGSWESPAVQMEPKAL